MGIVLTAARKLIGDSSLSLRLPLHPTVVRTLDFYYHFITIDGIDLPHFAVSVTESQFINNFFCPANRGKLRQTTAFHTESVP